MLYVSHVAFRVGNNLLSRLHVFPLKYRAIFIHVIKEQGELNCTCIQRNSTNLNRRQMINY